MIDNVKIWAITEQDIGAFRAAVDAVARERQYLSRLEGPSIEGASHFVLGNIANANPHYVAVRDDGVIGWCDVVRGDGDCDRHTGTMGMGLLPPWRGKGIGRRLLSTALASADAAQLLRIELSVHAGNERAIRLYRSLGFETEGLLHSARLIGGHFKDIMLMARLSPLIET